MPVSLRVYLGAGSLDLTTGATAPNTCPGTLWQTLRRWENDIAPSPKGSTIKLRGWKLTRDETGKRSTLGYQLSLPPASTPKKRGHK